MITRLSLFIKKKMKAISVKYYFKFKTQLKSRAVMKILEFVKVREMGNPKFFIIPEGLLIFTLSKTAKNILYKSSFCILVVTPFANLF